MPVRQRPIPQGAVLVSVVTYRVVQVLRQQRRGWTVERIVPGETSQPLGFYETEAAAQAEADRLNALERVAED